MRTLFYKLAIFKNFSRSRDLILFYLFSWFYTLPRFENNKNIAGYFPAQSMYKYYIALGIGLKKQHHSNPHAQAGLEPTISRSRVICDELIAPFCINASKRSPSLPRSVAGAG
jgi:hypothetical protein